VNGEYTSLVPANRLPALPTHASTQSDSAYPNDGYIWSASASEDGSFHFFAVPPANSQASTASGPNDFLSGHIPAGKWNSQNPQDAVAQYTLYANMAASMYGRSLNLYA
jgi:hypothetical protein